MNAPGSYSHTQRAPLYLLFVGIALATVTGGWFMRHEPGALVVCAIIAVVMAFVAMMFGNLTVED